MRNGSVVSRHYIISGSLDRSNICLKRSLKFNTRTFCRVSAWKLTILMHMGKRENVLHINI